MLCRNLIVNLWRIARFTKRTDPRLGFGPQHAADAFCVGRRAVHAIFTDDSSAVGAIMLLVDVKGKLLLSEHSKAAHAANMIIPAKSGLWAVDGGENNRSDVDRYQIARGKTAFL